MIQKYRFVAVAVLLLLIQWAGPVPAVSQDVEYPLIQSMYYFPYSDNSLLQKGTYAIGTDLYYSNVYMHNHERTVINDMETFSHTLNFRYGLSDIVTLEAWWRWSTLFGGFLDRGIEKFHSLIGLPDNGRSDFPRRGVHYRYKDLFYYQDGQEAASPLVFSFLNNIHRTETISLKSRFSVGIPLSGKVGLASGKPVLSLGLIFDYRYEWFFLELSSYLAWSKQPKWMTGDDLRRQVFYSRLEMHARRFIGGFIFRSSPFPEGDISGGAYQMYIGYQITPTVDFIILEDFHPFDTTPDVSFQLRIRLFKDRF